MDTETTALSLIQARWSKIHPFDLDKASWHALLAEFPAGDLLEAIKRTAKTRDPRPEKVYASLLHMLDRIAAERTGQRPYTNRCGIRRLT
jgi:hypothetical protein